MGIANYTYNRSTSGGEIITHLINASDGAGLHFNGTSGYVSAGDSTILDGATRFAVEVIAATSSTTEGDVFSKCRAATAFRLYFKADGKIHFRLNNSTSNGDATSAGSYNDGNPKHIVATWDALKLRIYVNGNLDGEGDLVGGSFKNVADFFAIGAQVDASASASYFNGTVYRARLWNRDVSADVQSLYENASIDFADQWGVATNKITGAVDKNWGTAQADSGNDANDRATFDAAYVWVASSITDISVVSNVLQFSTAALNKGVYYNTTLTAGKRYRITVGVGAITGTTYSVYTYATGYTNVGSLVASTTNSIEFIAESGNNGNILIFSDNATAGTIQLNAASVSTEVVASGVVADYDLAFANPSPSPNGQSLMVRDRASAADGTSSATGVTQVTPIEQLNAKAARIGTSAATPADGELRVDDIVRIEGANPELKLKDTGGSTLFGIRGNADQLDIRNANSGAVFVTIDSTGLCSFSAGIAFSSQTDAAGMTETTLNHYEEGTWTPTLLIGGSATGITYSTTTIKGSYVRVGRLVTVNFDIALTSKGSQTGEVEVSSLPFTVKDILNGTSIEANGISAFSDVTMTHSVLTFKIRHTADTFGLMQGSTTTTVTNSSLADTTTFRGTCVYITD